MDFDIPSISAIVAAVGVIIGVVFTVLQLKDLAKTRRTDLFIKVYSIWGSARFSKAARRFVAAEVKDYADFVKKQGPQTSIETEPSQIWLDIDLIGWFFNEIGFLVNERLVSAESVYRLLGYWIILSWEKMQPLVYGWRSQYNMPESFSWYEYLYNEMKKRE
jgi:hypothetical protein